MIKKFLFFGFFFTSILFGFAQNSNFEFKHISTSEGLSQSSAIAIHQDKLGQIWVGTRDGLNKYDGNKFTIYRNISSDTTSISNNDILSIHEDIEGFIWIGTYNGLNKFNPKKNTFTNYFHNKTNSLSNNTIWTIKEMSNGEIWVGTSDGLSIYDKKNNIFHNIYHNQYKENSLANNHVLSIIETKNNEIWIGTAAGLSKLKNRNENNLSFDNYRYLNNNKNPIYVQDILENTDKNLLLASRNNGVLLMDVQSEKLTTFFDEEYQTKINQNVRQLVFDDNNSLWIGTYEGLLIVDKNKEITTLKTNANNPKGLSKNSVKSIFKDKKGSIWIGTYYGGLNIWDKSNINFINFTQEKNDNSLSYDVVSAIENYKNKDLFIGTEGGGITVFNLKDNTTKFINKNKYSALSNDNIKSLLVTENDKLWVGTVNTGLAVYDLKTDKFTTNLIATELQTALQNVGVYALKKDAENQLWIGTFGEGLFSYNIKEKTFKTLKNSNKDINTLSSDLIRGITIDAKNNIWVATQRGLNLIKNSNFISRFFYNSDVQSGDDISAVFEDVEQQIWVGTRAKGLFKFNGNSFDKIDLSTKTNNVSAVHSILEDHQNNLWISTNQGIIKYNKTSKNTKLFNQKDGLIDNEFNDNASLKINNSRFFFGSPSGISSFDTNSLTKNEYSPQVIITDFIIKSKSLSTNNEENILENAIEFTNKVELSYDKGNFSIQFAIPNFINAANNSYQYRLKGLEEEWMSSSQNLASYTIQNAGNYVFEVKGANSDGVWNTTPTRLEIKVHPAPWKSWWAFLIYLLIIGLALYFLITILKSKTKLQHQLALEYVENERIEETNKAKLEFFTNISHEFRTPLTLILGPLQQILGDYKGSSKMFKKLLVVESSAKHLLTLINRLMDFRKLEKNLFKLEAAEGNIIKFLKEIYLSFSEYVKDGDYEYSFHTTDDEILVYYDRYKLERVFYNLISNAFRYTPKNGNIAVRVKTENGKIIITVEDSGVGIAAEFKNKIFERFFEIDANNKPDNNYNKGTGIGLSIVKNIVALHKGKIDVKNNINNIGSIFSIELPLGKTHLTDEEILNDFKFSDDLSQYVNQLETTNIITEDELEDQVTNIDKKTILLVEDNKPLRSFMKDLLKKEYNILEAENGKIALKMANKYSPDLIVSDVVMPVMVGTELCAEIKKDIKTSHIPIILLTSRSSLVYKLEGLESGADDYLSKPFNVNEFKVRVKNLINASNRLKEKFSGGKNLLPNEVIVSSLDEKLFKKALEIVEENIANEEFDIPYFCSELGVSRTMLFVKIKAWTSFTPNDFIQHFRMKRAAQLLEQGKINISEVSYKVGFKNPKYFSKCFQKKYGETPSQYANKFSEY